MGYPSRRTVDRLSARVPTQEEYEGLRLASDLPVLRAFRVVYSDEERPIEATIMAKAGDLFELQYEFV
jgi:GntR family transcriptional regulator